MTMPDGVKQAVIAIWITLVIDVILALYNKTFGIYNNGEFFTALVMYLLFCIVPYKLSVGSNPARYIYVIMSVLMVVVALAGVAEVKSIDLFVSVILAPVEIFIIYRLFQQEAGEWFTKKYAR